MLYFCIVYFTISIIFILKYAFLNYCIKACICVISLWFREGTDHVLYCPATAPPACSTASALL